MASKLPSVSIVVPALNEAGNIAPLIRRIDAALLNVTYEIIFIDDHSTDNTLKTIKTIAHQTKGQKRHIAAFTKVGLRGKAFSLLEGFEQARFNTICIIDADLQYPPEAIPEMLEAIVEGSDVVVANRQIADTNILRRALSKAGRTLYGKWLYGLDCDVQSGLKLFRRVILDDIVLNSTSWTFDLSFLVQAREKGHKIGNVSILFAERSYGDSKINVLRDGFEIFTEAIKFKISKRKLETYADSFTGKELA